MFSEYMFPLIGTGLMMSPLIRLQCYGARPAQSEASTTALLNESYRTLDTLHLALTIQAVYTYLVTGFGDRIAIDHILWYVPYYYHIRYSEHWR